MIDVIFHGGEEGGNIFAVETRASAGQTLESHVHEHSHLSVLVSGVAEVVIADNVEVIEGYKIVNVPANTKHSVTAITDVIWLCLWAEQLMPLDDAEEALRLVG